MTDSKDLFGGVVTCLVLMGVGNWMLRWTKSHKSTLSFQLRLFTIALLIRFAASVAVYQFGLWAMLGDADATGWSFGDTLWRQWQASQLNTLEVLMQWRAAFEYFSSGGESGVLGHATHVGYYYLLGTFFYLIGASSRMIAAAINCFVGSLIVVFAYRTARTLFSEWVAARVAWWTCLFPSMIVWSAQTVKEPVVILLEVITVYCCVRLRKSGFALRYIALAGFAIALMLPFRFYAAYIGIAAFAMVLIVPDARRNTPRWSLVAVGAFFIAIATVAVVLASTEARLDRFDMDFVQKFRHDIAEGSGSGVTLDVDMRTTTGFSVGTLVGAAYLLFAPFPWQLGAGSLRMVLTAPELMYWWWLFAVGVLPGVRRVFRTGMTDLLPLLVFLLGLGVLYSMTFGNIGLVFRQRAQLLPWLFVLAGVGLEQRAIHRSARAAQMARRMPLTQYS